jgi:hypothetical protein
LIANLDEVDDRLASPIHGDKWEAEIKGDANPSLCSLRCPVL